MTRSLDSGTITQTVFIFLTFQTLFDPYFISFYNVMYTSLPVLVLGLFDQVSLNIHTKLF